MAGDSIATPALANAASRPWTTSQLIAMALELTLFLVNGFGLEGPGTPRARFLALPETVVLELWV